MTLTAGIRTSLLAAALLAAGPVARADDQPAGKSPPQQALASKSLKLTVYLPDAQNGYYRGARFDWSGLIARAEYRGHAFYGEWRTPHDPENHDDVVGPAEEFGMTRLPLGYDEAKPGQTFLKIGIGELEKVAEPKYSFAGKYRVVKPGAWQVTSGPDWVEFRQDLQGPFGYAYRYTKRIRLAENAPRFTVSHTLKNTGTRPIDTDNYCHNFTLIDGDPVGPHYRVRFAFPARPKDDVPVRGPVVFRDRELTFGEQLKGDFYAELTGLTGRPSDNDTVIEDDAKGAGLRIRGDTALSDFHVWGVRTALCPEPFIRLELAPGREAAWATDYTFFTREGGGDSPGK